MLTPLTTDPDRMGNSERGMLGMAFHGPHSLCLISCKQQAVAVGLEMPSLLLVSTVQAKAGIIPKLKRNQMVLRGYTYTGIHLHTHTHAHTYIQTLAHTCTYIYMHSHNLQASCCYACDCSLPSPPDSGIQPSVCQLLCALCQMVKTCFINNTQFLCSEGNSLL